MEDITKGPKLVKPNPRIEANCIKRLFFCWLWPLFYQGARRELTEKDLYQVLDSHESSYLGDRLESAWEKELTCKKPSLWRALARVFGKDLSLRGIYLICIELGFKLAQPILLSRLLKYYAPNSNVSQKEAYIWAALIVIFQFLTVLSIHRYMLGLMHFGMKIRVACCSLIYRKALRLSKSSLAKTTIGQMVNLLSNDVSRFDMSVIHIHNLWLTPIQIVVISTLLYYYGGWTTIVGVAFLILILPLQTFLSKLTSRLRLQTAIRTDERVRLMNEIICGIQVIKMYTWEKPFSKLVALTRINEMNQIYKLTIIRSINATLASFLNRISIFVCVVTYVLTGNIPTPEYVFVLTSFNSILRQNVTMFFPQALTIFAETNVSVKRIQNFLEFEEIAKHDVDVRSQPMLTFKSKTGADKENLKSNSADNGFYKNVSDKGVQEMNGDVKPEHKKVGIDMQNVSVKWIADQKDPSLNHLFFNAHSGQLIAIVGPVGSGKTTLLHTILRELPILSGTLDISGSISYASQEPWLFTGSVRQNILFGEEFDDERYAQVVRVCALERDFKLFPYGDKTVVGERGVMLSGGQRARINLARAVYKKADIYLLDDPLSAVDTNVGKQLFDNCICQFLAGKITILVTHQLQYLKNVDRIYLLDNGVVEASGTFDELQKFDNDFTKHLLSIEEEETEAEAKRIRKDSERVPEKKENEGPAENKESKGVGKISSKVYTQYFKSSGSVVKSIAVVGLFVFTQIIASGVDYFITFWVNLEQMRFKDETINNNHSEPAIVNNSKIVFKNETSHSRSTYEKYDFLSREYLMYIYTILIGALVLVACSRAFYFAKFCRAASTNLHNSMFEKIVYGKMYFFNSNPSGRILNRFAKDMGSVDDVLPITLSDTMQIGLIGLCIILLISTINPWIIIPSIIIAALFYGMRTIFLASSRDIKRMEGITKSPVYTHITASLQGLTTIRAFNAEKILKHEFDNHQNLHSSAFYMFLAANRTFGFWLDLHCVVYTALVLVSCLFIEKEIYGGNVGLTITQALALTGMFQWGMRQWSELENQMTAVERICEYGNLDSELGAQNVKEPPKNWPEHGTVVFENVSMRYSKDEPNYVLKNLNFAIKDTEKIGIVGRTGAGKSSLIYALFRLTEIEGAIKIDGIDTKTIDFNHLRKIISIIPQEPVLFSGSLRKNLDPFDEYDDAALWNALEEVELRPVIAEMAGGLNTKISEGGSNFSVGQRQLLCLARAIVRNNRILVLDEATANVDPQTDSLIQSTIRSKFANCTVLTIAHRLHTIMDSDRILVMDAGKAVEFDAPHLLLQNTSGVFYGLVQQTGKGMIENLTAIAEETYKKTLID